MKRLKKISKIVFITLASFILFLTPFNKLFSHETNVAEAAGVSLIGGATVDIALGKNYYAQVQFPSSLGHLLKHSEIRDHIKLKYSRPAPLLGFIPIKGEVKEDNLLFDTTNNIASGAVNIPLNISLAGVFRFTFEIDIAALDETIPLDTYEFKINVGDEQLDLPLLEFRQSMTRLEFGYQGSDDEGDDDEDNGSEGGETSKASSKATVVFLPNDSAPPVVDPTDPTQPYEPDPNNPADPQDPPTGNTGYLTLDYVSSIQFGEQTIEGNTQVYETEILRPFIQVSDRRGTGSGWAVTATASQFEDSDENSSLSGSVLTFKNGSVISPGNYPEPFAYPEVKLHSGGDSDWVLWAEADTGLGTWTNRWFPTDEDSDLNDNVTLEVPGGSATIGDHKSIISWTLTDAPGQ